MVTKNSFVYFSFFLMSMQKYLIFCVKHLSHNGQTIMLCMDRQKIGILCVCVSAYVDEDGDGGRKFLLLNWIVCYLVFHECDNVRPLVMYRNIYVYRKSLWRDTFFINKLTIAEIVLWPELEQFLLVKVILICHKKYDANQQEQQ